MPASKKGKTAEKTTGSPVPLATASPRPRARLEEGKLPPLDLAAVIGKR